MTTPPLLLAFCSYQRADRLRALVAALRAQQAPVPFEILAVDNNSPDGTSKVLAELQRESGPTLKVVCEPSPGIVPARNRALACAEDYQVLAFLDDDELPRAGWAAAAWLAIQEEGADCAGGQVCIDFSRYGRPAWLNAELSGFLAAIDHGPEPFWIMNDSTPVWTSNIAYRVAYLRTHGLRFDHRYNRQGASAHSAGGGEDVVMLRALLARQARIRYRPDMIVDHDVEPERLRRRWFLRLHFQAGVRKGIHEVTLTPPLLAGVPRYLFAQSIRHWAKAIGLMLRGAPGALRQAMTAAHALGLIKGCRVQHRARIS